MREILTFLITLAASLALVVYVGSKRKRGSRYERSPHPTSDWQKLDRGIDPSE